MKTNKNGVKLLAALMVFTMALVGFTIVDNNGVDAATEPVDVGTEALLIKAVEEGNNVVLKDNITLTKALDLKGITVDAGKYTIKTGEFKLSNGTVLATGSDGGQNNGIAINVGKDIENVNVIVSKNETSGNYPWAVSCDLSTTAVTVTGCNISSSDGKVFGAIHVEGAEKVTITNTVVGTGIIQFKDNTKMELNNCGNIIIQTGISTGGVTSVVLSNDNLKIDDKTHITETIIGWDSSTMDAGTKYQSGITLDVKGQFNLGKVVEANGNAKEGTNILKIDEGGSVIAYGGDNLSLNVINKGHLIVPAEKTYTVYGESTNAGTLTVDGTLEFGEKATLSNSGALYIYKATENTNALDLNGLISGGQIKNTNAIGGNGWSFQNGTLTFTNYDGKQYFDGKISEVTVTGSSKIAVVDSVGNGSFAAIKSNDALTISGDKLTIEVTLNGAKASDIKDTVSEYKHCAIMSSSDVTVKSDLEINVDGILTAKDDSKIPSEAVYAIYAAGKVTFGAAPATSPETTEAADKSVEINVFGSKTGSASLAGALSFAIRSEGAISFYDYSGTIAGGNRAIQSTGYATTFNGCDDLTLYGSEKAIQAKGTTGSVSLVDSNITAALIDPNRGSNSGVDDYFAIKAYTLTINEKSTLNTQGLRIVAGGSISNSGFITVTGDYKQNMNSVGKDEGDIKALVAGLYYEGSNTVPAVTDKATKGKIYLKDGAQTYGKISLIPSGSESAITQDVIEDGAVSDTNIAGKGQVVITGSASLGAVTITGDQKVIVTDGITIEDGVKIEGNGILEVQAIGTGLTKTFTVGDKSVSFNDFKGIIQISVGSIVVDGMEMSGNLEVVEDGTTVKLSGSIAAGKDVTIRLTGATTTGTVLVLEDKTLTIPQNSKLILENGIKMSNDGQIVGGGTINVSEKAQFYTSNPVSVNFTGTGQIILEDATETLKLSDKLASSMTTEPTQKVIITGNLTIKENQYLVITGDLEIPEGVTVTIENGGQLRLTSPTATATIAGTIKSLGQYGNEAGFKIDGSVTGDVIITGQIIVGKTVENKTTVNIEGYAYLEGTITVNAKTIANFGKLEVAEAGVVTVKGTITGKIYNQGTVVIDGAVNGAFVYNQAVTAVVKIDSLSSGTLTVSDAGLYLQTIETQRYYVAGTGVFNPNAYKPAWEISENAIEFTNVEGITVTESMKYKTVDDERLAVNHMEIQGAVTVSNVKDAPANPVMTITEGTVDVIETLDISKAQVSISIGAALVVYGTVNLDDSDMPNGINDSAKIEITVNGNLYVYGLVRCIDIPVTANGYIEAVAYEVKEGTKTIYYYTNLADAIASGVKDLEVLGDLTILKDTTIPAGIEIDAAGSDVLVGKGDITEVTLTVADGGYLAFKSVEVIGTFVIENTDDGVNKMTNITSDTSVISENTAMYTNLLNALNSAESGEVRITKIGDDPVVLGSSATVKKDVTLVVPSSKKLSIVNGVTLTIDGILKLDGEMNNVSKADNEVEGNGFFTQTVEAERPSTLYSVVKVNGTIISASPLTYGNGPVQSEGYKTSGYNIPGAQFEYKTKYYLTTIEQAAPVIKTVDASTIKIYGDNKVGTVAFEGTSMMPAAVKVYGNITAESFTIAFGEIYIDSGIAIEGTFGSSVGTITVKNMKVNGSLSMTDTVVTINDEEVQKVYVKGYAVTNKADVAPSLTFNGKVEVYKNDFSIDATYNTTKYGSITIAENATVTVSGDNTDLEAVGSASKITVNGELITTNDGIVKSKTLVVMGTLDVREAQGSITAGKIDVTNLYIGGTTSDVTAVGGAAAVNAPVSGVGLVYLFPGSTVTGTLSVALESEDAVFTEFYVEDALWLTVYNVSGILNINIVVKNTTENSDGTTTTTYKYNFKPLTIKEKEFKSWQYMSSGKLTNFANTTAIGEKEKVYADIKYDVYDITVYACEGIDDVYVDGVIMTKTILANLFTASVVAGEHTISYTLTNGYSGTATMYIDDKAVSGLKFTAEGDFSTASSTIEYTIKLQGIEKSGYVPESPDTPAPTEPTEDEGLGITEYLLIVLVVLAAILVVVVAIRMMRS